MQSPSGFAQKLTQWYQIHKRDLPWRETKDSYKIWVSEIILQQTRVVQGLPYYNRFVTTFPTVKSLAQAPLDEVLRLWQGLGYYSRARNMHEAAKFIMEELSGEFPSSFDTLLKMKGVGRYTAAAIASFAHNEKVPVVDGNVQRVLSRVFGVSDDISVPKTYNVFESLAAEHITGADPATFNQAIMEFGAQYCVPLNPDCPDCIFKKMCFAYKHNMVVTLPVKSKKTKVRDRYFHYIVFKQGNKLGMSQRKTKDIWEGLHDFHLIESDQFLTDKELLEKLGRNGMPVSKFETVSDTFLHILSHQKLHAQFYVVSLESGETPKNLKFYYPEEIDKLGKPVLILKYLQQSFFL